MKAPRSVYNSDFLDILFQRFYILCFQWSCIHDIQEISLSEEMDSDDDEDATTEGDQQQTIEGGNQDAHTAGEGGGDEEATAAAAAALVNAALGEPAEPNNANGNRIGAGDFPNPSSDIWAAEVSLRNRNLRVENTRSLNMANVYGITSGLIPLSPSEHQQKFQQTITVNVNRMLYYIEEPNKGKGFIKEPCFSSDGRIICSPHGYGVRLLAFNAECNELPFVADREKTCPKPMYEIKTKHCHSDVVVSCKFSPKFPLLVSGCLRGKIVWHQPVV